MHQKLTERVVDLNPRETSEWVEALEQVLDQEGPDRAAFLLERLTEQARGAGADLPIQLNTPYVNTIRPEQEARRGLGVAVPG
jgi:pyruvate dehydrogenase E1 component